jgi:hypothetical protein
MPGLLPFSLSLSLSRSLFLSLALSPPFPSSFSLSLSLSLSFPFLSISLSLSLPLSFSFSLSHFLFVSYLSLSLSLSLFLSLPLSFYLYFLFLFLFLSPFLSISFVSPCTSGEGIRRTMRILKKSPWRFNTRTALGGCHRYTSCRTSYPAQERQEHRRAYTTPKTRPDEARARVPNRESMCRVPRDQSIVDDLRQSLEKHLTIVTRTLMKRYDNAFETQMHSKILMQRQKPTVTDKASQERPIPLDNVRSATLSQASLSADTAAKDAISDDTGSYHSYSSYSSDGYTTNSD